MDNYFIDYYLTFMGIMHFISLRNNFCKGCCILAILMCHGYTKVFAQNLVVNGDFEKYNNCPSATQNLDYSPGYSSFPTGQAWVSAVPTCDYYHSCATTPWYSVPYNWMGHQAPHSGQAYAGIAAFYVTSRGLNKNREIITTRLAVPLEKDSLYTVSFFVSPTAYPDPANPFGAAIAIHEIGAHFSDTMPHSVNPQSLDLPYHVVNDTMRQLIDTTQWYEITGRYKARGGEQWMTIGNFGKARIPAYTQIGPADATGNLMSYVYLDDVSVVKTKPVRRIYSVTICANPKDSVKLVSSHTTGTYQWSTGQTSPSIIARVAGLYTCRALDNTELLEEVFQVVEKEILQPQIVDTAICAGVIDPQLAPLDTSLIWYSSANATSGNVTHPAVNTSFPGKTTFWVARKEGTCISEKKAITVTILSKLTALPHQTAYRCLDGATTFVSIGSAGTTATRYRWNTGDTVCCITTDRDGMHIRTASNDCNSVNDTFMVRSSPCKSCTVFPDAFTPNGDGRNDEFKWFLYCPVKDFHMSVYNRWGQRIFHTDNQNEYWDGGNALAGTYMYMVTFTHSITGYSFIVKGDVTLIR